MRAPPLARMAAVAAPRPEAEPVTIAHKPSFDIRISFCCFLAGFRTARRSRAYHIVPQSARKSANVPLCGIYSLPDDLHATASYGPADNACHGYGFCPSLSARKDRTRGLGESARPAGANQF